MSYYGEEPDPEDSYIGLALWTLLIVVGALVVWHI